MVELVLALREGDVLLLRGTRLVSAGIGLCSDGWSHAAVVLAVGGELCFAHATPNPASVADVLAGVAFGGVTLTRARDELDARFYAAGAVYRPRVFDAAAARRVLASQYGLPYERSVAALACATLQCCPVRTYDSVFCTELVATVLGLARPHATSPADLQHVDGLSYVGRLQLPRARSSHYLCNFYASPPLAASARDAGRAKLLAAKL
jgi:hypothetical protein